VEAEVPTDASSGMGGAAPVRAKILACSLRANNQVEEVVATEESLARAWWR